MWTCWSTWRCGRPLHLQRSHMSQSSISVGSMLPLKSPGICFFRPKQDTERDHRDLKRPSCNTTWAAWEPARDLQSSEPREGKLDTTWHIEISRANRLIPTNYIHNLSAKTFTPVTRFHLKGWRVPSQNPTSPAPRGWMGPRRSCRSLLGDRDLTGAKDLSMPSKRFITDAITPCSRPWFSVKTSAPNCWCWWMQGLKPGNDW